MDQALLEIGLYFDERADPVTQEHMSLADVGDKLIVYPLHYFRGKHDITLHHLAPGAPGFLVLYSHLVSDPHIDYLAEGRVRVSARSPRQSTRCSAGRGDTGKGVASDGNSVGASYHMDQAGITL